ncbi:MAG: DUF4062 domain-containing protein [Phycisphaeraceae bacterium]
MSDPRPTAFVSATSRDLRSYREHTRQALLTGGVFPVVQEHFPPDYRSLVDFLRAQIERCDLVICLVGFAYGAAPTTEGGRPRSYTQLEYDVARELRKPVYVFVADEGCPLDQPPADESRYLQLQLRHRADLLTEHKCTLFRGAEELRLRMMEMLVHLERPTQSQPLPFFYLHPPKPPVYFAGRSLELAQLTAAVSRPAPSVVVVAGIGGQGKTSLMAQWLQQNQPALRVHAGFWCTAYRGGFTFDAFVDAALEYLMQGRFDKRTEPDIQQRLRRLIGLLQQRPTLMVLDGIERWLSGWSEATAVTESLPAAVDSVVQRRAIDPALDDFLAQVSALTNGTHLLLTTRALPAVLDDARYALVPVHEEGAKLTLDGLDDEAAVAMLRALGVQGESAALLEAARGYDKHPLALNVLGGLLVRKFGGRLERLDHVSAFDPHRRLFELFEETRRNLPGGEMAERFLQAASLCLENPSLATVAAAMGYPLQQIRKAADDLLEQVLSLAEWHLIEWNARAETLSIHPLMRQFFASKITDAASGHRRLSGWYESQTLSPNPSTLADARPRILAIEHALAAGDSHAALRILAAPCAGSGSLEDWLDAKGHLTFGANLLGRLASSAASDAGTSLRITRAGWLRRLGRLDDAMLDLSTAIVHLESAGADTSGDPIDHTVTLAGALMTRGNVHRQAWRYDAALRDVSRAIDLFIDVARQRPSLAAYLATAQLNRGSIQRDIGQLDACITDTSNAIALFKHLRPHLGDSLAPSLATALQNRGNALADLLRFDDALTDYQAALAILMDLIRAGREDVRPQWFHCRLMEATTLVDAGQPARALPLCEDVIIGLGELVDAGRPDQEPALGLAFLDRALAHLSMGNLPAATDDSDRAVAIFDRLLAQGRGDVRGWWTHSRLVRAEAKFATDPVASRADRIEGLDACQRLIAQGEEELRFVLLRRSVSLAIAMLPAAPAEAVPLLRDAFHDAHSALQQGRGGQRLRVELRRAIERLAPHGESLKEQGLALAAFAAIPDGVSA